jgi:uncharacterized protein
MKISATLIFLTFVMMTTSARTITISDISFSRDGIVLQGKFYKAEGAGPFATILILPGFPGNQTDVLGLGKMIAEAGINMLTFNYCGTHRSEGEFSFENAQKDIAAAYRFLAQPENIRKYNIDPSAICLGGWCCGGGMALAYASRHPEITAVFSIVGNDHGEFLRQYNANTEMKQVVDNMFDKMCQPGGVARIVPGQLPKDIAVDITKNLDPAFDFKSIAPVLAQKNILLIGAWDDVQVPFDGIVFPFYRALRAEKAAQLRLVGFQDDHYFRNSRTEVAQTLNEWIKSIGK